MVKLNGRELGGYVLKEGYSDAFLTRAFGTSAGALHEGSLVDLTGDLEWDKSARTPNDLLRRFTVVATNSPFPTGTDLGTFFDMEHLNRFVAVECMLQSADGYWFSRNNYRVYEHPTNRLYFIPHSADRIAAVSTNPVLSTGKSLLSRLLMPDATWRQQYYQSASNLLTGPWQEKAVRENFRQLSNAAAQLTLQCCPQDIGERRAAVAAFASRIDARLAECQQQLRVRGHWDSRREFVGAKWHLIVSKGASTLAHDAQSPAVASDGALAWSWTAQALCRPGAATLTGVVRASKAVPSGLGGEGRITWPGGGLIQFSIIANTPFLVPITIPDDGDDLYTRLTVETRLHGTNLSASLPLPEFHLRR